MISDTVVETLQSFVPEGNVRRNEPMAQHTSFRVGGPAECIVEPENAEQLAKVKHYLWQLEMPYLVIGNGTNLLFSDVGYSGVIVKVGRRMSRVSVDGCLIRADAGVSMIRLAQIAQEHGLTGLEFASGIPGTIGGGVVMNAGAYGGEMSQVVQEVEVLDRTGEELCLDNAVMDFGYRSSAIRRQPFTVTGVTLRLEPGDPEMIRAKMDELTAKRRAKQPLEFPSAGSTFKRPEGYFAGELIMKAGMRGFQIGGARVSEKHCGFVINTGNATSADILDVIHEVQERVKERFGVDLEPEVVIVEA